MRAQNTDPHRRKIMSDPDDAKPVEEEATWANGCSVCQSKGDKKFKGKWYCNHHHERRVAREALW